MPAPTYESYHIYHLPRHLLDALTPQTIRSRLPAPQPIAETDDQTKNSTENDAGVSISVQQGSRACNVCLGAIFSDVDAQRAHFRSDWHRYNVKLRLGGGQPVSEARFAQLVEGLEDSLSGSASSTDDEDEESDDAVSTLISRTKSKLRTSSRSPSPGGTGAPQQSSPLVWFHTPPATQLGFYKLLFPTDTADYLHEVRAAQTGHGENGRTWVLFMVAGGHFAGAVVRVSRSDDEVEAERLEEEERAREEAQGDGERRKKKPKPKKTRSEVEILKHKTFHRYTTRRKQGGSQSLNDNAKHKAKSAGAQLRRYGEQALRDDIQGLLREWGDDIADCERIWIRASWTNRRMFLEENGGTIEKGDERLRNFPFPTRRPTQSELVRCLSELVRVKVTHFTEEELRAQDEAYLASLPKPKPKPTAPTPAESAPARPATPARPTLTPEQQTLRATWQRALDMISRGRVDALRGLVEKGALGEGGVDARVPPWMDEAGAGRTLLMLGAAAAQAEIVRWLLEEAGADPTLELAGAAEDAEEDGGAQSDASDAAPRAPAAGGRRVAYDLARTRDVRDVFRRAAGAAPAKWDWLGAARVPSALTREMEEGRGEKKKARRKGLKDKIKERETREAQRTPEPEPEPEPVVPKPKEKEESGGPRKLGGVSGSSEATMGLTPEMRAKIERERRARAAEARLKNLGGR